MQALYTLTPHLPNGYMAWVISITGKPYYYDANFFLIHLPHPACAIFLLPVPSKAHSYSPAQWKQAYSIKYSCVLKLLSFVSCIVSTQNHDHSIKACHSMSYCQLIKWGGLLHTLCCSLCNLCEDVYLIFHTTILQSLQWYVYTKAIAWGDETTAWYFMMRLCTQGYYCMKDYCMHGSDVKVREISTLHDGHDLPE